MTAPRAISAVPARRRGEDPVLGSLIVMYVLILAIVGPIITRLVDSPSVTRLLTTSNPWRPQRTGTT
ncbi:MAG: hypothetical protein L0H41_00940 [Microlunatus sp.]|nr:hypothetical protein [Microlunatus sp.]